MANERIEKIVIEEGFSVEVVTKEIIEGVKLEVYDNTEAALCIGEDAITFKWTLPAARLFENLTPSAIELLSVISQ